MPKYIQSLFMLLICYPTILDSAATPQSSFTAYLQGIQKEIVKLNQQLKSKKLISKKTVITIKNRLTETIDEIIIKLNKLPLEELPSELQKGITEYMYDPLVQYIEANYQWTLKQKYILPENKKYYSLLGASFNADGTRLVTTSNTHTIPREELRNHIITVWNTETGSIIHTFQENKPFFASAQFSPDDKHIIAADNQSTINIWNIETGAKEKSFNANRLITSVAFSPDSTYIAAYAPIKVLPNFPEEIIIFETATGNVVGKLRGNASPLSKNSFKMNNDQTLFVYRSPEDYSKTAEIFNVSTWQPEQSLLCDNIFEKANFSPNGTLVALSEPNNGHDISKAVEIWNLTTQINTVLKTDKEKIKEFFGDSALISPGINPYVAVGDSAFSPDNKYIASYIYNNLFGGIIIWDLISETPKSIFKIGKWNTLGGNAPSCIVFNPNGESILIASSQTHNVPELWSKTNTDQFIRWLKNYATFPQIQLIVNKIQAKNPETPLPPELVALKDKHEFKEIEEVLLLKQILKLTIDVHGVGQVPLGQQIIEYLKNVLNIIPPQVKL